MLSFDKADIKEKLNIEDIFALLLEWGGDPEYTPFGIVCATICHNPPGQGSKKLYYYSNSSLFRCYTGCDEPTFDIFDLVIRVADIQWHTDYDLNGAIRWIAKKFGISGILATDIDDKLGLEDWEYLSNYERIQEIEYHNNQIILKEYDKTILDNLNYKVIISPWLKEGITQESINKAQIGYYLGGDQITIPHFDKDNRFVGLRGRSLCAAESELYGKYRPLKINGILYNHPLGMNLYGLNWAKDNIKILQKAIVFESEKSVLQYGSYFGWDNNIAVACCGSSISVHQIEMLIAAGAKEIVIGLDRQFQDIGDNEFKRLKSNLIKLHNKYKNDAVISFIFDKNKITGYKDSPVDLGAETFLQLFKERIVL
jgi:hypothetical protein